MFEFQIFLNFSMGKNLYKMLINVKAFEYFGTKDES